MTTYNDIHPSARVWIYQADRAFTEYEAISVKGKINHFVQQWVAHSDKVKGFGDLYYHRFIALFADEEEVGVSGCSIDSSVNFIKALGQEYQINFFDRFNIAYKIGDEVQGLDKASFEKQLLQKAIDENTIVFNNLIASKSEFETQWEIPMKDSWHAKVF